MGKMPQPQGLCKDLLLLLQTTLIDPSPSVLLSLKEQQQQLLLLRNYSVVVAELAVAGWEEVDSGEVQTLQLILEVDYLLLAVVLELEEDSQTIFRWPHATFQLLKTLVAVQMRNCLWLSLVVAVTAPRENHSVVHLKEDLLQSSLAVGSTAAATDFFYSSLRG